MGQALSRYQSERSERVLYKRKEGLNETPSSQSLFNGFRSFEIISFSLYLFNRRLIEDLMELGAHIEFLAAACQNLENE